MLIKSQDISASAISLQICWGFPFKLIDDTLIGKIILYAFAAPKAVSCFCYSAQSMPLI